MLEKGPCSHRDSCGTTDNGMAHELEDTKGLLFANKQTKCYQSNRNDTLHAIRPQDPMETRYSICFTMFIYWPKMSQ